MLRQSFLSVTMRKVCVVRTNKQERGHHGDISAMNLANMREKDLENSGNDKKSKIVMLQLNT